MGLNSNIFLPNLLIFVSSIFLFLMLLVLDAVLKSSSKNLDFFILEKLDVFNLLVKSAIDFLYGIMAASSDHILVVVHHNQSALLAFLLRILMNTILCSSFF
uniref:Uncharacterized protein n=1 Tax=Tanacetum cinerariifolium TaxID=118510 RepID=A0A6L2MF35_TANCI|nr:hypothetical protein [Tanacetum cinerariifolium]